ncbi:hypothetical protein [Bacillus infantis]|uniref:hypothetical protein n=1 Tax=Bacillus infantis TaxID=324767 RepID=UPI0020A11709|nr:hypothetical protein [Bacillus infantis]MCP1159454.1 hypothetical protein [Bacillus infantis]
MAGNDLKLLITGQLNIGKTINEVNSAIRGIEKKISKLKISADIDANTLKTLSNFSKAMEQHKKVAQDLNRVVREEKTVTKEADGTVREKIRQHLKSGEIIDKEIKKINQKVKATQSEREETRKLISDYEKLGQVQKRVRKENSSGDVTGASVKYKNGFTDTTYNTNKSGQVTSVTSVQNVDQERKATESLINTKNKLKQVLQQLNSEGKVSADNLTKLNNAINNSKNIQQVQKLEQNLQNLNRIRENEHRLEIARQQAQINAQRIKTTHSGFVDTNGLQQYINSVNNLTPRTANLNQQLQRSASQFNQVAQNARSAAGATQQAGMSMGEMLSNAMQKFPMEGFRWD